MTTAHNNHAATADRAWLVDSTTRECAAPVTLAAIATPADADQIGPWMPDVDGRSFRQFGIHHAVVNTLAARRVEVRTEGEQFDDGSVQRSIAVEADADEALNMLTPVDARALAAALLDAAERLDGHRCQVVRNGDDLRAALADYNACDDGTSLERAAARLATAVTQLLR